MVAMLVLLLFPSVSAQTQAFPYNLSITTVMGNCYDDCRIIIHIMDANGNEVLVNPVTHNAQNTNQYPLYNIQYHYRNVSAGANTQYDTVNDIQVTSGTYCIGVTAYVPVVLPGGIPDYAMVDTTLCNIPVATNYDHLEASVLSSMARNNYETWGESREFCGYRPSFDCADVGRIQLKLTKGKFPYRVLVINSSNDTIRQEVFYQRQQSGTDSIFADYRDFYTLDHIPVGDYSIKVSDSCDYSLWLSMSIPTAEPYHYAIGTRSSSDCSDSLIVSFYIYKNYNAGPRDYLMPYMDSIIQYRFINPGGDTSQWYPHVANIWDQHWLYANDTLRQMSSFCQLYNDTITFQVRNLCKDTIYTSRFFYTKSYYFDDRVLNTTFDMVTSPDTCIVHALSGLSTQTYDYSGYANCYYCGYENYDPYWPQEVQAFYFSCPLSYDIYSAVDSTLLAHNETTYFQDFYAPLTIMTDTVLPVHISLTDSRGCELISRDEVFIYNVQNAGDIPYPYIVRTNVDDWGWGWNACCWDRYLYIKQWIDADTFRPNMTVHLFESPLYNHYNFTAVLQNGVWSFMPDDSTNQHVYLEMWSDNEEWQVTLRDSICLVPGRYRFAVTSSCGTDTVTYVWMDHFYKDSLALAVNPQFDMTQICDRLFVTPHSTVINNYRQYVDPDVDNNEPYTDIYNPWWDIHVVDGVAGGYNEWRDGNGNFVFTIPGRYVLETYSSESCSYLSHYDTLYYVPEYINLDQAYAIVCDNLSHTGFVSAHAINGTAPYTYYLYSQPDLGGSVLGTSSDGSFPLVPMSVGQQLSVMAEDSCHNSFYINLTATPINQSALAWEFGDFQNDGHCEGDSVFIAALPFAFNVSYQWSGPNGFSSTDRVNRFYLPYGSQSGYYVLEVLNTGCATQVKDSVYIAVIPAPRVTILSDTTVCYGDGVTLAFQAQGNGTVNFDVFHSGAPVSGSEPFSVPSGSTIYQHYPIESDNQFWAMNVIDDRCSYDYLVDSVEVLLYNPTAVTPVLPSTMDGYACYNHTASLRASAALTPPYYVHWYQNQQQNPLIQCDTITNASNYSILYVNNVITDTTLYVAVSGSGQCLASYGAINRLVSMQNTTTVLNAGEGARFFDTGGELGDYGDSEQLTHVFSSPGSSRLDLTFNSVDIAIGDTLRVYAGAAAAPAALLATLTHDANIQSLVVNQSAVTFRFVSNWTNNRSGWSIDIFTGIQMAPVSAHVSPINRDTVAAVLCASSVPYQNLYIAPLDVSQSTTYLFDTLILDTDGCQTDVHFDVRVNPVSHVHVTDYRMPCQMPHTWNGVLFCEYGTQTAHLTNIYGCDSMVTMTISWHAPVDSTTVFDTIVENQLPYTVNGTTFTGPGVQVATLTNQAGCDSVVTTHLFVHNNVVAEADSVLCDNQLPLLWNGVTFTQAGTQSAVLTAHTGADSTLTMHVVVNPTHLTALRDTTCQYDSYSNYGFTLSGSETATSGYTVLSRTELNQYGCDSITQLTLLITPVVSPEFYAEPDQALLSEDPTLMFINTTDTSELELLHCNYYWCWDFGDGSGDTTVAYNDEHLYTQWGDYMVTLTLVANGCETTYSVPVIIEADLVFPNVITPNGDGINDVFIIKDLNPDRHNRLEIVDRWGRLVWGEDDYQTYMKDGIVYNAERGFGMSDIPAGVYFFTFFYQGSVQMVRYNGTITVIK